jgi:hypothetical protein
LSGYNQKSSKNMGQQLKAAFLPEHFDKEITLRKFYYRYYLRMRGLSYTTFRKELQGLFSDDNFSRIFGKTEKYLTSQQIKLLFKEMLL